MGAKRVDRWRLTLEPLPQGIKYGGIYERVVDPGDDFNFTDVRVDYESVEDFANRVADAVEITILNYYEGLVRQ